MRYFTFLVLLVFLLSSCGFLGPANGKLRYVKTDQGTTFVLDRADETTADLFESESLQKEESTIPEVNEFNSKATDFTVASEHISIKRNVEDIETIAQPLELNPDEDERIVAQAYEAERAANTSFILMVIGLVSAFAPYLGIIPFFIGLYFYSKSDRSRYITQYGERRLQSAQVVLIIDSVILILWLLLIVALIFL
jgi:hypothetical protein